MTLHCWRPCFFLCPCIVARDPRCYCVPVIAGVLAVACFLLLLASLLLPVPIVDKVPVAAYTFSFLGPEIEGIHFGTQ